ncbi:MAG: universal stress protein [Culicoidibacterales bacterium]
METLYKRVIVGIDTSETSMRAFERGVAFARESHAELVLMSAVHLTTDAEIAGPIMNEVGFSQMVVQSNEINQAAIARRKEYVEKLVKQAREAGVEMVSVEVELAQAVDLLLETYDDYDQTLIVLGATNKKGIQSILLGSVSKFVVAHAPCDVFIVR